MLEKEVTHRISTHRVKNHPFITNQNKTTRFSGEGLYDCFLSYRVSSDFIHAQKVYETLTANGLKVWWDKKCIASGEKWEDAFVAGILSSQNFICLLSRNAINNNFNEKNNLNTFTARSEFCSVLLEWLIALELFKRNHLASIFPVFIGDVSHDEAGNDMYGNYFKDCCHPTDCLNVVVEKVDHSFIKFLRENVSLKVSIFKYQLTFLLGLRA